MNYNDLRQNDVVFCESKKSRVLKLVSQKNNGWLCEDVFTKQSFIINEQDNVRLVNTNRKVKPISLKNLFEQEDDKDTLTKKEVFIIEYIIDTYSLDTLEEIKDMVDNGQVYDIEYRNLNSFLKYVSVDKKFEKGELSQYFICALNNYDSEITESTKIDRFIPYTVDLIETSSQVRYDYCYVDLYGPNTESFKKALVDNVTKNASSLYRIMEYKDMDYGDSFGSDFSLEDIDSDSGDEFKI